MAALLLAAVLAACAQAPRIARPPPELVHRYAPPGPPGDPWGPFVREAAAESGVAEPVLYAVMWAESRGCQWWNGKPMESVRGEAGLMQIPPPIYASIRHHIAVGPDPWLPRDNIRAAAWSLAQFIRQYGLPDALAAYEGGTPRLDAARAGTTPLPADTAAYERSVWQDAQARTRRREAGEPWTEPDHIVCTWTMR